MSFGYFNFGRMNYSSALRLLVFSFFLLHPGFSPLRNCVIWLLSSWADTGNKKNAEMLRNKKPHHTRYCEYFEVFRVVTFAAHGCNRSKRLLLSGFHSGLILESKDVKNFPKNILREAQIHSLITFWWIQSLLIFRQLSLQFLPQQNLDWTTTYKKLFLIRDLISGTFYRASNTGILFYHCS